MVASFSSFFISNPKKKNSEFPFLITESFLGFWQFLFPSELKDKDRSICSLMNMRPERKIINKSWQGWRLSRVTTLLWTFHSNWCLIKSNQNKLFSWHFSIHRHGTKFLTMNKIHKGKGLMLPPPHTDTHTDAYTVIRRPIHKLTQSNPHVH